MTRYTVRLGDHILNERGTFSHRELSGREGFCAQIFDTLAEAKRAAKKAMPLTSTKPEFIRHK